MKKLVMIFMGLLLLCGSVQAGDYRYVAPEEMKQWLETNKEMIMVDIQPAKDFALHHFKGSVETNAFPVETEEQRQSLDKGVAAYKEKARDVVVVCPRSGGGAKRCYDYLKSQGVPEERLYILTGGIDKWPYADMVRPGN